jgi:hypothetical protein
MVDRAYRDREDPRGILARDGFKRRIIHDLLLDE